MKSIWAKNDVQEESLGEKSVQGEFLGEEVSG